MNKLDLIIDALETATWTSYSYDDADICKQALQAARELRDMKPVSYQMRMKADWVADWQEWKECGEDAANDYINTPRLNDWSFEVRKLYALGESNE